MPSSPSRASRSRGCERRLKIEFILVDPCEQVLQAEASSCVKTDRARSTPVPDRAMPVKLQPEIEPAARWLSRKLAMTFDETLRLWLGGGSLLAADTIIGSPPISTCGGAWRTGRRSEGSGDTPNR